MKRILSSPLTLIITVLAFVWCSYWIVKNVKIQDLIGQTNVGQKDIGTDISSGSNSKYEIKDNNIVEIISTEDSKILVNGSDIAGLESMSDLSLSPDGNKICFLVNTIVPVWLYVYDIEANELSKVDTAKSCYWSPNSQYVAYNNHTTDVSPINVLVYDTKTEEIKNLSQNIVSTNKFIQCNDPSWVSDDEVASMCREVNLYDVSADSEEILYTFDINTGEIDR